MKVPITQADTVMGFQALVLSWLPLDFGVQVPARSPLGQVRFAPLLLPHHGKPICIMHLPPGQVVSDGFIDLAALRINVPTPHKLGPDRLRCGVKKLKQYVVPTSFEQ